MQDIFALDEKGDAVSTYIEEGFAVMPLNGKVPLIKDWVNLKPDPNFDVSKLNGKNYGVILTDEDLIIDIDPRNFNGVNSTKVLRDAIGEIPNTYKVKTGSGGYHVYFKKPATIKTSYKLSEFPGIEFKSRGGQVVGPKSIHPETKKLYEVSSGKVSAIADAPQSLLLLLEKKQKGSKASDPHTPQVPLAGAEGATEFKEDKQSKERFVKYLKTTEDTSTEGLGGDATAFSVACRGRDFALGEATTLNLMLAHWNDRCDPPWTVEELETKVRNAYKYNEDVVGKRHPASDFDELPELDKPKELVASTRWDLYSSGLLKKTLINVIHLMDILPDLKDILSYNQFTRDIEFTRQAPWHVDPMQQSSPKVWSDSDAIGLKFYLAAKKELEVNVNMIHEAAVLVSKHNTYHPVKNYLESIQWDKKPRVATWLTEYAGVNPSNYTNTVARKVLIAAISRIYKPACKFDHMLILEGKQGIGKSFICSILGKHWYGDPTLNVQDKDTIDAIRGKWILEVSEMECATRTETQALKAFISRQTDRMRPAYARTTEDFPRQSVFIGTINPESNGYLKDTTGNRRFWPVYCSEIKIEKLKKDIDQIWAEALYLFKKGETLYLDDIEIQKEAEQEAESRRTEDPWTDLIRTWVNTEGELGEPRKHVTGRAVWEEGLGGAPRNFGRVEQIRISTVLQKELGWGKGEFIENGDKVNCFVKRGEKK
jgi:predicted P-loop ATPase